MSDIFFEILPRPVPHHHRIPQMTTAPTATSHRRSSRGMGEATPIPQDSGDKASRCTKKC